MKKSNVFALIPIGVFVIFYLSFGIIFEYVLKIEMGFYSIPIVVVMKNGKATLLGSETLAGSSTNLLQEVRNLVSFGIPLETALSAVTEAPARAVRLDHQIGSIAVGLQADLLLLTPELELSAVYIDGKRI